MANIFDYLKWREDLTFTQNELNEVDSLILVNLVYAHFDNIVPTDFNKTIRIQDACNRFLALPADKQVVRGKEDIDLVKAIKDTPRFKDVLCSGYREIYDAHREIQFCAMTYEIDNHTRFVAYRGNDNFVEGWKEDLNLSFKIVPAQRLALTYLKDTIKELRWRQKIVIGGHSKGGNLAMYAAANLDNNEFKKITHISNFDGPGFDFKQIDKGVFNKLLPVLTTYTPTMSFVGNLMDHIGAFTYIESSQNSFMQHDPYTWQVLGKSFVYAKGPDETSKLIKKTIDTWLTTITYDERQKVIDSIYELVQASGARELQDILPSMIKNFKNVQTVYSQLDPATIDIINDSLSDFGSIFSSSMIAKLSQLLKKSKK